MIEHLIEAVEYTNGKKIANLEISAEAAAHEKQLKVRDDFEIPKNVKGPLPDARECPRCKDLPAAVDELNKEIDAFEQYFSAGGKAAIHAGFGPMNRQEWILWHGKHFAHHFTQFGLLNY